MCAHIHKSNLDSKENEFKLQFAIMLERLPRAALSYYTEQHVAASTASSVSQANFCPWMILLLLPLKGSEKASGKGWMLFPPLCKYEQLLKN